jgi:hypothetical protein
MVSREPGYIVYTVLLVRFVSTDYHELAATVYLITAVFHSHSPWEDAAIGWNEAHMTCVRCHLPQHMYIPSTDSTQSDGQHKKLSPTTSIGK